MGNPENKEAPNASEKQAAKDRTETARRLGEAAIKGANKK